MRKVYHSVYINLASGPAPFEFPLDGTPEEIGNIVYDQLIGHKDIDVRFAYNGSNTEIIIPYHAIAYASVGMNTNYAEAPVDTFCGGDLEVKILPADEMGEGAAVVSGDPPDCMMVIVPFSAVESITFNGEEISVMDFAQAVEEGHASVSSPGFMWNEDFDFYKPGWDCSDEGGSMTIDMTFTYMGASTTVPATFNYTNGV